YGILQNLHVPGVVKAYAIERYGKGLALILEGLDAEPLNKRIQAGTLDLRTILSIGHALAEILATLHERRIIHKDVKPQNILFDEGTKKVSLIDFGIATRLTQETQQAAPPDALEGTLAYISPEQTGRMNRVVDHRTDLYSLGVTLYEMLTGQLPF